MVPIALGRIPDLNARIQKTLGKKKMLIPEHRKSTWKDYGNATLSVLKQIIIHYVLSQRGEELCITGIHNSSPVYEW